MIDPGPSGPSEAVCFTAGPKGTAFAAGVIHAWLAADREHPSVAAGISSGALSAAAMQRCFRELEAVKSPTGLEGARWAWFRRYLDAVTNDPLDFIWRAVPDPVDFYSDRPPVVDKSTPSSLGPDEARARRHFHILTKLGVWLGSLPIRLSTVTSLAVHHVRLSERYGFRPHVRAGWLIARARIAAGVWWHMLRAPKFFIETRAPKFFIERGAPKFFIKRGYPRPLFGWKAYGVTVLLGLGLLAAVLLVGLGAWIPLARALHLWAPVEVVRALQMPGVALAAILAVLALILKVWKGRFRARLIKSLCASLDISVAALDQYYLHRGLLELFRENRADEKGPLVSDKPMQLLLVCAALQDTAVRVAESTDTLMDGLLAALAFPGVFPPLQVPNGTKTWDLVDGAVIRQNPLPALFTYLRDFPRTTASLERPDRTASVHVVYDVPIGAYTPKPDEVAEKPDIVEAALASLELARRRDTRQEVVQANFRADLQRCLHGAVEAVKPPVGSNAPKLGCRIFADEIAPPSDLVIGNLWSPDRKRLLAVAAAGCRATLETLYSPQIRSMRGLREDIACHELLDEVAPARKGYIDQDAPGIREVCGACPRRLRSHVPRPLDQPHEGLMRSYGQPGVETAVDFSAFGHLEPAKRVVYVASGGVFRGAFQIGSIAALHATEIKPHLVVGASVGALMGAAFAALSVSERTAADTMIERLACTFLHVDSEVALTATLKNAAKQLGIRGRAVHLSPSEVRRMVRRGSRADAGYAAAGAPPALIDAISSLFLIPHEKTVSIASQFLAGHFSSAANAFLSQLRNETLPSLDIRYALMGVSLMERVADQLLGQSKEISMANVQPYHQPKGRHSVSFFATTSYLNRRISLLLGRDFLTKSSEYNFLQAALSSSAFPSVFSPRTEAEVVPGRGDTDVFFADGGMFDNLPFLPAIEVLAAVRRRAGDVAQVLDSLQRRYEGPDVFIAVALDPDPQVEMGPYDDLVKIYKRAKSLKVNGKIDSFKRSSNQIHEAVGGMVSNRAGLEAWLAGLPLGERMNAMQLLDGVVDASVLKVVPTDAEHVNGTFQFCRSLYMDPRRIQRSIADGCFQTLWQLDENADDPRFNALAFGRLTKQRVEKTGQCAWYRRNDQDLPCPFAKSASYEVRHIRTVCGHDAAHAKQHSGATTIAAVQAPQPEP